MKKNQEEFKQIKKPELIAVGIDVSKETLAICERYENRDELREIKNNKTEIRKFSEKLSADNFKGRIVMESTGRYHLQTAFVLSKNNLDTIVINPLIAKKYSSSSIRKVKTDKRDSQILAEIAVKEDKLPKRFNTSKIELIIKKKLSLIALLDDEIQKLNAAVNEFACAFKELNLELSKEDKKMMKAIGALKKRKEDLEKETEKLIGEIEQGR